MKILVTGAAGFIGFYVARALLERGDEVVGIDDLNEYYDTALKRERLRVLNTYPAFSFHEADIAEPLQISVRFDTICHLGAQAGVRYSIENPSAYERSNMKGTLNIFEYAKDNGVSHVVYASSSSVYGDEDTVPFREDAVRDRPVSLYAATKRANELYAHVYYALYGIKMTGLRFFTVYGPLGRPDMAYFSFTKNIIEGKPIKVFNEGNMSRDFTYVSDIVEGVVAAIDNPFDYEIFNLGRGKPESLRAFIETIEQALGKTAEKELLPMQPGDVPRTYADISKAERMLGYKPRVDLDEGIKNFVDWYTEYYGRD